MAWIGWNFSFGEEPRLGLTPMVGGVFGQMKGIAPGLTLTLDWGPLALWSQSEYVFDLGDSSQSFFYAWTEFSVTGPEWLRVGVVLDRTRAFQTSTEVQGGPLMGSPSGNSPRRRTSSRLDSRISSSCWRSLVPSVRHLA